MESCSFLGVELVGAIACFRQLSIPSRYLLHQSISLCLKTIKALCRAKPSQPNLSRSPKKLPVSPPSTMKQSWEFRTVSHNKFNYGRSAGKSHTQNPVTQSSPSLVAKSPLPLQSCCAKTTQPGQNFFPFATIKFTRLSQSGATAVHNTQLVSNKT